MKKTLFAGAVAGSFLAVIILFAVFIGRASASWSERPIAPPPQWMMSTQAPNDQAAGGAGELHWTVATLGECVDIDCTVDCRVQISKSSAPVTCTATTCQRLSAKSIIQKCLMSTEDYISVWMTAAGNAAYAIHNAPK